MPRQASVQHPASVVPNFIRGCVRCWNYIIPLPANKPIENGGLKTDSGIDLEAKCPACQLTPRATFILWTDTVTKLMRAYPNALKLENRIAEIKGASFHSDHYDITCLPKANGTVIPPFSIPKRQIKWGEPSTGSSIFKHTPNPASPPEFYILDFDLTLYCICRGIIGPDGRSQSSIKKRTRSSESPLRETRSPSNLIVTFKVNKTLLSGLDIPLPDILEEKLKIIWSGRPGVFLKRVQKSVWSSWKPKNGHLTAHHGNGKEEMRCLRMIATVVIREFYKHLLVYTDSEDPLPCRSRSPHWKNILMHETTLREKFASILETAWMDHWRFQDIKMNDDSVCTTCKTAPKAVVKEAALVHLDSAVNAFASNYLKFKQDKETAE